MAKEAYVHGKRGLCPWQKRPIRVNIPAANRRAQCSPRATSPTSPCSRGKWSLSLASGAPVRVCTCTCTCTCKCACVRASERVCEPVCVCACSRARACACVRVRVRACALACVHTVMATSRTRTCVSLARDASCEDKVTASACAAAKLLNVGGSDAQLRRRRR